MQCNEFLSTLHDYFMGKLAPEAMTRSDEHAARCESCGALMARARELSCREFADFLNAYIDGELEPGRKTVFERHLEICSDCRNYLQSYRQTMKMSALAFRGELLPEAIPEDLVLAILEAGRKKEE